VAEALGMVDKLDANVMVTGQASVKGQRVAACDDEVMRVLLNAEGMKAKELDGDAAKAVILPELKELRVKITKMMRG